MAVCAYAQWMHFPSPATGAIQVVYVFYALYMYVSSSVSHDAQCDDLVTYTSTLFLPVCIKINLLHERIFCYLCLLYILLFLQDLMTARSKHDELLLISTHCDKLMTAYTACDSYSIDSLQPRPTHCSATIHSMQLLSRSERTWRCDVNLDSLCAWLKVRL